MTKPCLFQLKYLFVLGHTQAMLAGNVSKVISSNFSISEHFFGLEYTFVFVVLCDFDQLQRDILIKGRGFVIQILDKTQDMHNINNQHFTVLINLFNAISDNTMIAEKKI